MTNKQGKKVTLPAPRARSGAAPTTLFKDLRDLIQSTRAGVAQAVNSALIVLYWQVGHRIRSEILKSRRAEYGEHVVRTLATQLTLEFGQGFAEKNLRRMIQLVEVFPDREIVVTLSRQLGWSHFLAILPLKDPLQRLPDIHPPKVARHPSARLPDIHPPAGCRTSIRPPARSSREARCGKPPTWKRVARHPSARQGCQTSIRPPGCQTSIRRPARSSREPRCGKPPTWKTKQARNVWRAWRLAKSPRKAAVANSQHGPHMRERSQA